MVASVNMLCVPISITDANNSHDWHVVARLQDLIVPYLPRSSIMAFFHMYPAIM